MESLKKPTPLTPKSSCDLARCDEGSRRQLTYDYMATEVNTRTTRQYTSMNDRGDHITEGGGETDDILKKWRINRRLEEAKSAVRNRTYHYRPVRTPLIEVNRHSSSSYNDESHYIIEDIHNGKLGQYESPSSIVTMPTTHNIGSSYPLQSTTANPISSTRQQELCTIQTEYIRHQPLTAGAHCMRGICKPHANTTSHIKGQEVSHSDCPHVHHCCHGSRPCHGVSYCRSIHRQCDSDSEINLKESLDIIHHVPSRVEMPEKSNEDYKLLDKEQENCCNNGQSNDMYKASGDSMIMTPSNNTTTMADELFIDELVSQVVSDNLFNKH